MKRYRYFIIPIVCMGILISSFNNVITRRYEDKSIDKNLEPIKHTYDHILRDRGGVLKDSMFNEDDLILLGSSELSSPVDQNPINVFPFKEANYDVSIFGRAYTQSLQHATMLSSTDNIKSDSKVALIVSLQWFTQGAGITGDNFSVNFSEHQFYKMFNNDKISDETKMDYAKRINQLLKESGEYGEEQIYAYLYSQDNLLSNIALTLLKPYYKFKAYTLEIKDKTQSYKELEKLPDKVAANPKEFNWEEEYAKAEKEGAAKVTNNDINVEDSYYDLYLREKYSEFKDELVGVDLMASREFKDYELFLDTSKDLGVKPLIILMPVNGLYYNHLGITEEKRDEFYNKLQELAEERGFSVVNLQDKEYEKYYLTDVMHLGWKGWLKVNEEIYKYFSER
ncbi:MAG: D-alanyl-lipoteichoic acid biosynthesis protein DltD [Clostridium sp.]|uniref:D-alanyl-lipoteichoic acid biosynthesis protein DltD n=1 Tax=Clostridium sp. TaxID=1506 RepID=UPI00304D23EF